MFHQLSYTQLNFLVTCKRVIYRIATPYYMGPKEQLTFLLQDRCTVSHFRDYIGFANKRNENRFFCFYDLGPNCQHLGISASIKQVHCLAGYILSYGHMDTHAEIKFQPAEGSRWPHTKPSWTTHCNLPLLPELCVALSAQMTTQTSNRLFCLVQSLFFAAHSTSIANVPFSVPQSYQSLVQFT